MTLVTNSRCKNVHYILQYIGGSIVWANDICQLIPGSLLVRQLLCTVNSTPVEKDGAVPPRPHTPIGSLFCRFYFFIFCFSPFGRLSTLTRLNYPQSRAGMVSVVGGHAAFAKTRNDEKKGAETAKFMLSAPHLRSNTSTEPPPG